MSRIPSTYIDGLPLYWGNEQSGLLAIAVNRFFRELPLHSDLIEILKDYLRHWVNCPSFALSPEVLDHLNLKISETQTVEDLRSLIDSCLLQRIDPF
jgi:hypothetical protein